MKTTTKELDRDALKSTDAMQRALKPFLPQKMRVHKDTTSDWFARKNRCTPADQKISDIKSFLAAL